MKKCFTINPMRTTEDFLEYEKLLSKGIFQGIEIFYPYTLSDSSKKTYTENVEKIHKKYPEVEVVMHLPYGRDNDLCDFTNYQKIVDRLKEGIIYTSQFKTKKLTLHLGAVKEEISREVYIEHIVPILRDLCNFSKTYKMAVMIENMPGKGELGFSPEEILTIIQKVNLPNLKFILDTGHAHVSGYENPLYIRTLKDYLYHMHFSDNDRSTDQHKRIGLGNIDFKEIFLELAKADYNELHCLEVIFNRPEELLDFAQDMDRVSR